MKKLVIVLTVVAFALGLGLTTALATDPPADVITITNYGKKDAVKFDHAKHKEQGVECATCHHNEKDGKFKCGDCHKGEAGDAPTFKDAAHKKEQGVCWKCHNKKSPDVKKELKCKDCHAG